jgi:hypothetical protein
VQTISNQNDLGVQTEMDITDSVSRVNELGIGTSEVLNVNTRNLNETYLQQLDDFGMDITELFTAESSNQSSVTSYTEAEMQTIDLNSDVGIQTLDQSIEPISQLLDRGVQTRPDLHLDLLPPHGFDLLNGTIPPTVDLALIEAYVQFPEVINATNGIVEYFSLIS